MRCRHGPKQQSQEHRESECGEPFRHLHPPKTVELTVWDRELTGRLRWIKSVDLFASDR
jgi:hypothetical protein